METEYRRDVNHTYLLMKDGEDADSYEKRMFLSCRVPGLLACSVQHMNNCSCYCYDVTSKLCLERAFEDTELKLKDLKWILGKLLLTASGLEDYLLPAEHLILDPKLFFINVSEEKVWILYAPFYSQDFTISLRELMDYLLPKLDRTDAEAIMTGYRFYRRVMEPAVTLAVLREDLEGNCMTEPPDTGSVPENSGISDTDQEDVKDRYGFLSEEKDYGAGEKKNRFSGSGLLEMFKNNTRSLILIAVLLAVILLSIVFMHPEIVTDLDMSTILGGGILAASIGIALGIFLKNHKKVPVTDGTFCENGSDQMNYDFLGETGGYFDAPVRTGGYDSDEKDEEDEPTVLLSADRPDGGLLSYLEPENPLAGLERIELHERNCMIGKMKASVDFVIKDPAVSRVHAAIHYQNGVYYLSDCNSKNGTKVNGDYVYGDTRIALKDGDRLCFAGVAYIFRTK